MATTEMFIGQPVLRKEDPELLTGQARFTENLSAPGMVWMAMVLTNLDRTADAIAAFRRAARTDPTSVDAWIGIANAEMNRHDLEAAAEALNSARRFQPDRPAVTKTAERLQSLQAEAGRRPRPNR